MRSLNPNAQQISQEIEYIQIKRKELISAAKHKEQNQEIIDAICLYTEAQHFSYYVGDGRIATIQNEDLDRANWHELENKIGDLKKKISSRNC
ncbi:hypothetical protein [Legionella sainthelensi]|uniref:Uncharacterized protein n=1 Tax=Legionella sainthelensi TaxID=28087 RepID=A0A2H5FRW9_9GAMM|nr:hypothetical protein [Legionella sainthelensi]AUH74260.1 hypothetical protein CAB17_20185 [Legionella sainthelensi]